MQPYFFPYIGYFQLMKAVETFIMLDDAQYVERSWMNRNRINLNDRPAWITMPVRNASRDLAINQRFYMLADGIPVINRKIQAAYSKSPFFADISAMLAGIFEYADANVARFNSNLLISVGRALDLHCQVHFASEFDNPLHFRGEARILDLCQRLGVTHYVNAIGGTSLYQNESFRSVGIRLSFIRTRTVPQQAPIDIGHLSIIHDMMQTGTECTRELLNMYDLVEGDESFYLS